MATGPEPNKPCIFPFKYNGKEYNECTTEDYGDSLWCGTTYSVTHDAGWGLCSDPSKPRRMASIEGQKVLKSMLKRVSKNANKGFRKSSPGRASINGINLIS